MWRPICLFLALSLSAVPTRAQELLLQNARIIDPTTKTVTRSAMVIREGKIDEVLDKAPTNFDGKTLDLNGKWVIPGLNDLHVHSYGNLAPTGIPELLGIKGAARRMLYAGVTGFLDLSNFEDRILSLRDRQRAEGFLGADIYAAGTAFTCPNGHGTEYPMPAHVVESPKEARRAVEALALKEPDVIKIIYNPSSEYFPSMDRPTMKAIIEAAKTAGIKTVVHIDAWSDALQAVEAGADAITHTAPAPVPDRLLTLMKKQGTYAIPTLAVHTELTNLAHQPERLGTPLPKAIIAKTVRTAYRDTSAFPQRLQGWMQHQAQHRAGYLKAVRTLHQNGIPLLAGTDAGNPGVFQGYSLHSELQLLVEAGLSPREALAAATTTAGQFLDEPLEIAPGNRANLVILNASPLDDIHHTQNIAGVVYDGRVIDREHLLKPSGGEKAQALSQALLDNFSAPALESTIGTTWTVNTDKMMGGSSTLKHRQKRGTLRVEGRLKPAEGAPGWTGLTLPFDAAQTPRDVTDFDGVRLQIKAEKGPLTVKLLTPDITNYDYHAAPISESDSFQTLEIPFADFQKKWSASEPLPLNRVEGLMIAIEGFEPTNYSFAIDEITFYKNNR